MARSGPYRGIGGSGAQETLLKRREPIPDPGVHEVMTEKQRRGLDWQIWVFLFVAFGMFATAAYTIVETYWG